MKIIAVAPAGNSAVPQYVLMADSCVITTDRPFFLPAFAPRFTARLAVALRMERQGKSIARRFASRYVGSAAPAAVVVPHGHDRQATGALDEAFDGALLLGNFTGVADGAVNEALVECTCGAARSQGTPNGAGVDFAKAIEEISSMCTIKTGDIILLHTDAPQVEIEAGFTLNARLNKIDNLTIRIK